LSCQAGFLRRFLPSMPETRTSLFSVAGLSCLGTEPACGLQQWGELLIDIKRRGSEIAPELAIATARSASGRRSFRQRAPTLLGSQSRRDAPALDTRGFRAWWTQPGGELVLCDCGWRPGLGEHFRIERVRRSWVWRRGRPTQIRDFPVFRAGAN
jgi:hypothetical protein